MIKLSISVQNLTVLYVFPSQLNDKQILFLFVPLTDNKSITSWNIKDNLNKVDIIKSRAFEPTN